ncbi:MAG: hypothetical protein J5874_04000 [Oscillospiraceae bacterium]|nr:hypothetical protein [Oscillospiraceae bacterium]
MKLLKYEFKKLFSSKGILLIITALLFANAAVCFFYPADTAERADDEYKEEYTGDIQRVIRLAEINISDLSDGKDSYIIDYQEKVIEKYSALLKDGQTPQTVKGYGDYFRFTGKITLLLVLSVVIGSAVSLCEKESGMKPFLFISKRGKQVNGAKLSLLFILSTLITAVYSAINLIVCGFKYGLSGLFAPLVSVQSMEFCPYPLSIIWYFLLLFALSVIITFALSVLSALIGKLTGSYIFTFLCSGTVCAILYSSGFDINGFFVRYRALNLFDKAVDLLPVTVIVILFVCTAICVLFCIFGNKQTTTSENLRRIEMNLLGKIRCVFNKSAKQKKIRRAKRHGLYIYELKKLFISSKLILLVVLLLGVKVFFCVDNVCRNDLYEEEYYRLCTELAGELTVEKAEYIASNLSECETVISQLETMRNKVQSGQITSDEYSEFLERFYAAEVKQSAFSRLNEQKNHVEKLQTEGKKAEIIYDTGWRALLFSDYDPYLYALILLLFAGIYTVEYKNGMGKLLSSAKNGGRTLDRVKIVSAVTVTALLCIVFITVDFVFMAVRFPLESLSAPSLSVIGLPFALNTSLLFYTVLYVLKKTVGFILFSVIICIASKFMRKLYITIPAVISITLLPHLLIPDLPYWIDFINLLR